MKEFSRGPKRHFFFAIFILATLAVVGILQVFHKPETKIHLPTQISTPPSEPGPTTNNSDVLAPNVRGDENIIDVDTDDARRLPNIISALKPGDTLRFADGEYQTGALKLSTSGKEDRWIKLVANSDAHPKLNLNGGGDFHISGSYVYVEGLEIFNGEKSNLRIASTTHTLSHVYIKRVKLHSLKVGPGSSLKIQRNNANGVGVSNIFIEDSDLSQSTTVSVVDGIGANQVTLRNNFIHTDSGFAAGVTFKGGSSKIVIENNYIKGVRKNPAIVLGGRTFLNFFDPQFPDQEGVDQIARNNIIVDFDEAAVSFQGVRNAKFLHNTILTKSSGPIFNFSEGNTNDGAKPSKNQDIRIENNLIVSQHASSIYAMNFAGHTPTLHFGKQMWVGNFLNSNSGRISVPQFPLALDVSLPAHKASQIFESLQWKDIANLEAAKSKFRLREKTLRTTASTSDVPLDFLGNARSESTSFGAIEFSEKDTK